ncbi:MULTISPECIES: YitT family protein [Bacillus]|uniref:YitT family protein n=1 Tax=Bacillus glycinifermentans TaxID=1664069 RepID=A0AAJ4D3D3_9BACI|nr:MULTISPECIES: YitT family protein [Bacillus]KKB74777.1 membrane protein [Bacillus sp. TH008]MBU8784851.1 YitT family protein [Bacillus glycinifermentans]MDU0070862.1 YitT family protein [Bacillus sp. IG6]MED8018728.1 YitT family protein [Bacillus glycinifermentans]NUJ18974.1 YitT family protein [Bacillus glycinifermentans]
MFGEIRMKNVLFILAGAAVFSFGLVHFNMQNNLSEGGFTGITLLLYFLFKIDPSISNLVLNIPVFIIGWRLLGRTVFAYSIIGTVSLSVFLWIFQRFQIHMPLKHDLALAALFAGVFIGTGLGIIFRYGGTTGGVDIIVRLVNKYFHTPMGKVMFVFDACVITLSLIFYLSYKEAMYTLVAVFVASKVIDFMQEGGYAAKGATIISEKNEQIQQKIIEEMERGVTVLKGQGSYTKAERDVLYCVVPKNEVVLLKNVITSVDPHAFVAVSDVHDVLGEGFTLDENKNPISR